jgi:predicted transcriptional regulator
MSSDDNRMPTAANLAAASITDLFHRINRVLPENQLVLTVPGEMIASEALKLLRQNHFSQVPVVVAGEVLGMFTYRSFADTVLAAVTSKSSKIALQNLTVEECLEKAEFARVTDEFESWFDSLDAHNAVLVGEAHRLQGIVTPMDVLRYLYEVASPFVLVAEMELGLRALMRRAVTDEKLAECAKASLSTLYAAERLPTTLEDMTFHDYVQIIGDGRHWPLFEPVFRSTRERTRAKLEEISGLRNDVFHFRKPSVEDHERLGAFRDWVLTRARAADARAKDGAA